MKYKSKFLLLSILIIALFLRLWKINEVPVSLFSDELDVGYHAYSILETGKDYSGNPWPLHFESYPDLRTPLYIYSAVPTVAIFGITALGVRLPAVIFGVLGILAMYLFTRESTKNKSLALVSALVLAFSPWHIQYSRAAFEVTLLILLYLLGFYLFFKSTKKGKLLWLSALCFGLTPWVYSSAKLFTPFLLAFLLFAWRKEILRLPKKYLFRSLMILIILGAPMVYTIFAGGGAQRFSYISVFTDPVTATEVDYARLSDAVFRQSMGITSYAPKVVSRLVHTKYTFWGSKILNNYFSAFSTDFLFIKGDLNLRHSIEGVGQFYKIEVLSLILGLVLFFTSKTQDRKVKVMMAFWILVGVIPSAITRDGGRHATRLILILPPLVFLISYGLIEGAKLLKKRFRKLFLGAYLLLFVVGFVFYQHNYWVHNPWYSERWWHTGYKEVVEVIEKYENDFQKIVITNANDQPQIFLAAYSEFDPSAWQQGMEVKTVDGFGELEHIDKFYFGQALSETWEDLYLYMGDDVLYIAAEREIGANLILEPQKTPLGLELVKAITYPSGEPAFYFLTKP